MKLSFKDVFIKANVNPSTASFQRDKFIEFFPCIGKGRNRKYGEESVEVLTLISSMYADGKGYEDIKEALEAGFGVPVNITASKDISTTTTQQGMLDAIRTVFQDEISKRDEAILRLEKKVDDLIFDAKTRDEIVMKNIRTLQTQQSQQLRKTWWQRLFGKDISNEQGQTK